MSSLTAVSVWVDWGSRLPWCVGRTRCYVQAPVGPGDTLGLAWCVPRSFAGQSPDGKEK